MEEGEEKRDAISFPMDTQALSMASYRTPEYTHCIRDPGFRRVVYEPEADTFLLLEALDKEAERLRAAGPSRCVEIGCGSGVVITHLAMRLEMSSPEAFPVSAPPPSDQAVPRCSATYCAVDVNPTALEASALTWNATWSMYAPEMLAAGRVHKAKRWTWPGPDGASATIKKEEEDGEEREGGRQAVLRAGGLHLFQGDLFEPLARQGTVGDDPEALFDVILFNPPYVPTSTEELQRAVEQQDPITAAWCGGARGREITDRFIRELPKYLSPTGVCYLVLIRENDEEDVMDLLRRTFREHAERVGVDVAARDVQVTLVAGRYTGEHLRVYRVTHG